VSVFSLPGAWLCFSAPFGRAAGPRTVVVTILSVKASDDADTDFLFFEDRADIYGTVTIDGQVFNIPVRQGDDDASWFGNEASFSEATTNTTANMYGRYLVTLPRQTPRGFYRLKR